MKRLNPKHRNGFSLIEVLIVAAMAEILLAMVMSVYYPLHMRDAVIREKLLVHRTAAVYLDELRYMGDSSFIALTKSAIPSRELTPPLVGAARFETRYLPPETAWLINVTITYRNRRGQEKEYLLQGVRKIRELPLTRNDGDTASEDTPGSTNPPPTSDGGAP